MITGKTILLGLRPPVDSKICETEKKNYKSCIQCPPKKMLNNFSSCFVSTLQSGWISASLRGLKNTTIRYDSSRSTATRKAFFFSSTPSIVFNFGLNRIAFFFFFLIAGGLSLLYIQLILFLRLWQTTRRWVLAVQALFYCFARDMSQ